MGGSRFVWERFYCLGFSGFFFRNWGGVGSVMLIFLVFGIRGSFLWGGAG